MTYLTTKEKLEGCKKCIKCIQILNCFALLVTVRQCLEINAEVLEQCAQGKSTMFQCRVMEALFL